MKQKDVAVIIVIVFLSAVISYVASNTLFGGQKGKLQAQTVQAISDSFPQPDSKYFNDSSFDPTKIITIGQNNNTTPFGSNGANQ